MNTFGDTKSKISPRNILGGMGFFDESDYEREESVLSSITSTVVSVAQNIKDAAGGVYEAASELSETVVIAKSEESSNFPAKGSIEFNQNKAQIEKLQKEQKEKEAANKKRIFFQALKEDQDRAQRAKDKLLFEEEINDIATNLPTDQKNQLLHYQASYRDRSIYQRSELRKKIIEEQKNEEKKQQQASIAATQPKGQFLGEGDLINKEGSSQVGGVGDTGGVG